MTKVWFQFWGEFMESITFLSLNLKRMIVIGTFTLTLSSGVPVNLSQRVYLSLIRR